MDLSEKKKPGCWKYGGIAGIKIWGDMAALHAEPSNG
jgi:hypothetical protein